MISSASRHVGSLSATGSETSFSFGVIAVTDDVTVAWVAVFLVSGISQIVLFV